MSLHGDNLAVFFSDFHHKSSLATTLHEVSIFLMISCFFVYFWQPEDPRYRLAVAVECVEKNFGALRATCVTLGLLMETLEEAVGAVCSTMQYSAPP